MMLRMTLLPKFLLHACSVVSSRPYISGFDVLADFCERLSACGFCSKKSRILQPLWKAYNLALMVIDLVAYFGTDYCSVTAKATTFPGMPTECQCGLALQGVLFLAVDVDSHRLDKSMRCLDVLVLAKHLIDIYLLSSSLGAWDTSRGVSISCKRLFNDSILEVLELEGTSVRVLKTLSFSDVISLFRWLLPLKGNVWGGKWRLKPLREQGKTVRLSEPLWKHEVYTQASMEEPPKVVLTEIEEFCSGLQPNHEATTRDEEAYSRMDFKSLLPTKEDHVGKGLAGALQCFRENGSLKESRGEWIGRSRDKRTPENGKFEFNLDHRDEHGRTLTPKEAFRQFSHKFHHVKPGKRKQEKKLKKRKKEEHPLEFMERLRGIQIKSRTAYIRT
ncbi:hypothetical protein SELMODRAFT_412142 [Selaginella moellendorffii]|uniref:Uncharacterized protein n=1 Tax=Selaginella moellendorffii TaxID=88036 RepID=D8RK72_SELML|nr:hypothetical protein SELMODRAFT_412142 [Selaginella moellendorffii]